MDFVFSKPICQSLTQEFELGGIDMVPWSCNLVIVCPGSTKRKERKMAMARKWDLRLNMCLCVCYMLAGASRVQKRAWLLGTGLQSSGKATHALTAESSSNPCLDFFFKL